MKRGLRRPLQGLVAAIGAPLGWLALRAITSGTSPSLGWVTAEVLAHPGLYVYLGLGTATAFTLFGALLGRAEEALAERARELEILARHDPLTGLANRRHFTEALERAVRHARRTGGDVALLVADLDRFKNVNDTLGHPAGDEVLKAVARIFSEDTRADDLVARLGGEEFALLLVDTSEEGALARAERLRTRLEATEIPLPGGRTCQVTSSFGVATQDPRLPADDGDRLLSRADLALYEAKRTGRNRCVVAPPQSANGNGGSGPPSPDLTERAA
jgi:diguanylate cyclase (GGDEF)-like protein